MTPLDAARELDDANLTEVSDYALTCPFCGGVYISGDGGKPTGFDHYDVCPWLALPQIVAALEQGERSEQQRAYWLGQTGWLRNIIRAAICDLEDGDHANALDTLRGAFDATGGAALHGQEPADATPAQDEMIPCPNGCFGEWGEGSYGQPVPKYCGANGCDAESPGMIYRE